jgi:hypothetical protein
MNTARRKQETDAEKTLHCDQWGTHAFSKPVLFSSIPVLTNLAKEERTLSRLVR